MRPRCLASYRTAVIVAEQCTIEPPPFALILGVVDEGTSPSRLAVDVPACVELVSVRPSRLPRRVRSSLPCAVAVGPGGRLEHVGRVGGPTDLVRFAEACGDYQLRRWCKEALTRWALAQSREPLDGCDSVSAVAAPSEEVQSVVPS